MLNLSNRRIRTRTYGGVGGEESRDSPLSRSGPVFQLKKMDPGSAAHRAARHSASKTRVNALMALRSIRGTSLGLIANVKLESAHMSRITSPSDLAHTHRRAPRFDIEIAMRQRLHGGDQRFAGEGAFETTEFLG
jgi:hypothetical protein